MLLVPGVTLPPRNNVEEAFKLPLTLREELILLEAFEIKPPVKVERPATLSVPDKVVFPATFRVPEVYTLPLPATVPSTQKRPLLKAVLEV